MHNKKIAWLIIKTKETDRREQKLGMNRQIISTVQKLRFGLDLFFLI